MADAEDDHANQGCNSAACLIPNLPPVYIANMHVRDYLSKPPILFLYLDHLSYSSMFVFTLSRANNCMPHWIWEQVQHTVVQPLQYEYYVQALSVHCL